MAIVVPYFCVLFLIFAS